MRTGTTRLPLHGGKCPAWLFQKMKHLAGLIIEVIVLEFGAKEVLQRVSDPFWFQGLGCALGFDWHSSGLTTTTCAALKEGLKCREKELGFFIAGGKGKTSLRTPQEIEAAGSKFALGRHIEALQDTSRLVAKVDNTALQDGYNLYHHCIFFTDKGDWSVVQQGMNENTRWARRYHWLGEGLKSFVSEPHKAICCDYRQQNILNLIAAESEENRENSALLSRENPERFLKEWSKIKEHETSLDLPRHHPLPQGKRISASLYKAYLEQPRDFQGLLSISGVGPQTVRALSLLAELTFGTPPSRKDPVRYSFAHGGKDGHPYPVNKVTYEQSIQILKETVSKAKIGEYDKMKALKRLATFAKQGNDKVFEKPRQQG
ncbi:MAG: DUF763 domain-containing protein [Firmicutes bacterium]|nr:DUF763 domain-containing protein [Bacillota bacterium]